MSTPTTTLDPQQIIDLEQRYVAQTYARPARVFTHGTGAYLYDSAGTRYLDFCAGIAVNSLGHSDPAWVAAVSAQAALLTHVSNLYHSVPQAELAQRLVEHSFADRVFFCNSGAEANEGAIKFARKVAYVAGRPDKHVVVTFSGAFHGRTMGALAVTPREKYQQPFQPLMPGVRLATFNDVASAEAAIDDSVCAVIVEPIQGEGGVRPARRVFLQRLRELCDQHAALLIFDEVQCGLGRTGYLWAYEGYGVTPDIMTLAKPLANGLPIGAVLMTGRVADALKPGDHGSTFAGGALVCRAAQVVFDRVSDPAFLARVRDLGEHLHEQLHSRLPADKVVEIRGQGLIVGVELTQPVAPLVAAAAERGLIVIGAGDNVLRLVPPLIVDRAQITAAVDILADCLVTL